MEDVQKNEAYRAYRSSHETESIIETEEPTETEEIAAETETPPTDYNAPYPGFSSENITFNAGGEVIDYNEKVYSRV